jgi:hypothetical protein
LSSKIKNLPIFAPAANCLACLEVCIFLCGTLCPSCLRGKSILATTLLPYLLLIMDKDSCLRSPDNYRDDNNGNTFAKFGLPKYRSNAAKLTYSLHPAHFFHHSLPAAGGHHSLPQISPINLFSLFFSISSLKAWNILPNSFNSLEFLASITSIPLWSSLSRMNFTESLFTSIAGW